jgi:hypothetical protein
VVEIQTNDTGWKMELIIACGPTNDNPLKHIYLVNWGGYSHDEDRWERYQNVLASSLDLLNEYYGKNPSVKRDGCFGIKKQYKFYFFFCLLLLFGILSLEH